MTCWLKVCATTKDQKHEQLSPVDKICMSVKKCRNVSEWLCQNCNPFHNTIGCEKCDKAPERSHCHNFNVSI